MAGEAEQQLRAYVDYLRDIGIHDFYRQGEPVFSEVAIDAVASVTAGVISEARPLSAAAVKEPRADSVPSRPVFLEPPILQLVSFYNLAPLPASRVAAGEKADALA